MASLLLDTEHTPDVGVWALIADAVRGVDDSLHAEIVNYLDRTQYLDANESRGRDDPFAALVWLGREMIARAEECQHDSDILNLTDTGNLLISLAETRSDKLQGELSMVAYLLGKLSDHLEGEGYAVSLEHVNRMGWALSRIHSYWWAATHPNAV